VFAPTLGRRWTNIRDGAREVVLLAGGQTSSIVVYATTVRYSNRCCLDSFRVTKEITAVLQDRRANRAVHCERNLGAAFAGLTYVDSRWVIMQSLGAVAELRTELGPIIARISSGVYLQSRYKKWPAHRHVWPIACRIHLHRRW
jgi:hypothetical protein